MRTRRLPAADLTRGRWNETVARRVLGVWRGSGTSLSGFARASGVNVQRLNWWRKRVEVAAGGRPATVAPLAFIPATVSGSARVTVRLPGGVEIEGDAAALPADWVAAMARELGKA